jgi:hypothetical protein
MAGLSVDPGDKRLKAPFPWFGGKRQAASLVWERLGDVDNAIEPFCGSLAWLLARPHPPRIETVNDADCVAPETRILRADLSWVRAGEIQASDVLMGFDEENGGPREGLRAPSRYRHWRPATVVAVRRIMKPCYRLVFDDGTTVVASADHLWLGGSHCTGGRGWRWQRTEGLVCNRATQRSWVLKAAPVVERDESHDAGWLAGLYDGEGHLISGPGWRLVLSQKPGKVLDRAERLLRTRGYEPRIKLDAKGVARLEINGGMRQTMRLLMELRPERLIENLVAKISGVSLYGRDYQAVGLVSKEFLGEQEVVAIQTDSRTFIAEGLASHNCYVANFWRATQHDPEAVAAHADWPVNEVDQHARHRWLVLSPAAADFREKMRADPDYFDLKVAGWWCWGLCCWIGSGWCGEGAEWNQAPGAAYGAIAGVHAISADVRKRPRVPRDKNGYMPGVANKLTDGHRPQLADAYARGRGVHGHDQAETCRARLEWLIDWFGVLRDRIRTVRVCCGDWLRVCDSHSVTTRLGLTGIFFDPPYSTEAGRSEGLYGIDSGTVAHDVRAYCLERGGDPMMRIALAGYAGEGHEELEGQGWACVAWKSSGGYGNRTRKGKDNAAKERIWFSPHCLTPGHADYRPHKPRRRPVADPAGQNSLFDMEGV